MRIQQRYDLYGQSQVFSNGQAMQAPPPGTISRESVVDTGIAGTGLDNGREVTTIPVPMTSARLALGAQKFTVYCSVCHGPAGFGGSIVAENMGVPRPPSLRSAKMQAQSVGHLFAVITKGQGRMPSFVSQLTPKERWAVIGYLKQLQHTPPTSAIALVDSLRALAIARSHSAVAKEKRP